LETTAEFINLTDSGGTFTSLSDTLSLTSVCGLALHPTNSAITMVEAQDNGTQPGPTADPNRWEDLQAVTGGHPVINSADPSMMWRTYVYGRVTRYLNNGDITLCDQQLPPKLRLVKAHSTPRIAFYPPVVGNGVDNKIYFGSWKLYVCFEL